MKQEDIKAEQQKVEAKLQRANARLDEMAATAKQQKAKAVDEEIAALRAGWEDIQTRLQQFKGASDARASQVKAEIEAKLAKFEEGMSKLAAKLKSQSATAR